MKRQPLITESRRQLSRLCLLAAFLPGCEVPDQQRPAEAAPGRTADPKGQSASTDAVNSDPHCDHADEQLVSNQWERIQDVRKTAVGRVGSPEDVADNVKSTSAACEMATGLIQRCPTWNSQIAVAQRDVCTLSVRDKLAAERTHLSALEDGLGCRHVPAHGDDLTQSASTLRALLATLKSSDAGYVQLEQANGELESEIATFQAATTIVLPLCSASRSCADAKAFEAKAASTTNKIAVQSLQREAISRTESGTQTTQEGVRRIIGEPSGNVENLAKSKTELEQLDKLLEELRCYDPGSAVLAGALSWRGERTAAIAAEEKCLATPSCVAGRIANSICALVAGKRQVQAEIAKTKSYAGQYGVINLSDLNDLVETVKNNDAEIEQWQGQYVAVAGHRFDVRNCH